jgi:hypothetical protein
MQVYEVTKRRLMQLIFPGEYIEVIDMEYCLMREEENHHGSPSVIKVRTATKDDKDIYAVIVRLDAIEQAELNKARLGVHA